MVNESWFRSMWRTSWKTVTDSEKLVIGVMTFEVASLMSKLVYLWHFLSDKEVDRLMEEIMNSVGVRRLVSDNDDFLVKLVCSEIMENLGYVATSVARLGKKCTDPVWQRFEHVFDDLIQNDVDLNGFEYTWKKMDRKVKKMGKFIAASSELYQEMEVLGEFEQVLRRMQGRDDFSRGRLIGFQQKVVWQRQEVKNLRETSMWNRTYDYTVRLLARSLFTIFRRIKLVFGSHHMTTVGGVDDSVSMSTDYLLRCHSNSPLTQSSVHPSSEDYLARFSSDLPETSVTNSGPLSSMSRTNSGYLHIYDQSSTDRLKYPNSKTKWLAPVGSFNRCMTAGTDSPVVQSCTSISSRYPLSSGVYSGIFSRIKNADAEYLSSVSIVPVNLSIFSSKWRLSDAPPSTLGAVALALQYANVIIIIEKQVLSPHLIDADDRDVLYNMLPRNLRAALRTRIKSYEREMNSSVYDADLVVEWRESLSQTLEWLAPLAHNMVKWQSERSFEQQHLVSRSNVLLVQTLYFANQAKTEAGITELLVGLNRLLRFRKGLKSVFECKRRACDGYLDLKQQQYFS